MRIIEIDIKEQKLTIKAPFEIVSGSVGRYGVQIKYDEEWETVNHKLLMVNGHVIKKIEDTGGVLELPWECIEKPCFLRFGVLGLDGTGNTKFTVYSEDELTVLKKEWNGGSEADETTPPTPTIWETLKKDVEDLKNNSGGNNSGDSITVDEKLSETSENPVQNKIVTARFNQLSEQITDQKDALDNCYGVVPASVNKYEAATEHGLVTYTDGKFNVSENFRSTGFLPIKQNQQYVIGVSSSLDPSLVSFTVSAIVFYDSNKDYISGLSNVNSFTTPENAMYYRCSIYYSGTQANIVQINRCQIEEGNTLTQWRKYKEETGYITEQYAENIFEISNVELNIQNGYIGADGIFRENASYECVLLEVDEKEVYFINSYSNGASNMAMAYVYDEKMMRIPYGTNITVSQENINERFVIPYGAKYMAVTSYKRNNMSYLLLRKANLIGSRNLPLKNKKFIALGDSIVAQNPSWRDTFIEKTGAKQILCTAVAGAHLCDYEDTVLNGTDFTGHGNTVCNQVQAILNSPPTENIDFFMICAGTNDTGFTVEQLKAKDVSQFYSANLPIDIDTVDRTVIDGAMRWIAEKLWSIQPNATIFFATPIQAHQGIRTTWYLHYFSEYMKTVGAYLGTPIIPAFSESGIYSAFENNNTNGKYLIDGLHPNPDGKVKLGNYYANAVAKYFTY